MKATIYHNRGCGTSRNTLAMIRHAGIEPRIIEYLQVVIDRGGAANGYARIDRAVPIGVDL